MVFDFFKKKKKEDGLDDLDSLILAKMKPGFLVDYDDNTYTVSAKNYYLWEEGGRTDEWELKLGNEVSYLERFEEDGEVEWSFCKKFSISALDGDIAQHIIEHEDPPEKIVYKDITFYFEEDDIGEYFKGGVSKPLQFVAWDFRNNSEGKKICVEQWGETRFDVTISFEVEEYQFTNILPGGG